MTGSTGPRLPDDAAPPPAPNPSAFRLACGTVCGVGRLPLAPGTWGSLVTVLVVAALFGVELPAGGAWSGLGFGALSDPVGNAAGHPATVGATLAWMGLALGALTLLGCWVGAAALIDYGQHDPGAFVLDEVVGQGLALVPVVLLSLDQQRLLPWPWLALAFVAFRLFDIAKPPPVRQAERLPGGVGIMADDVVAGVFAVAVVWLVIAP